MQELIKISESKIGEGQIQTVNARDLHEFLESRQDFSTWIKARIEQYNFVENQDFILIHKKMEQVSGAKYLIEYHISLDMAKELSMVERNEKGKEARKYFIECEKIAKEGNKIASDDPITSILQASLEIRKKQLEHENRISRIECQLEKKADITTLLPDVVPKSMRSGINEVVRSYSRNNNMHFEEVWAKLYAEFRYRYKVDLKIRGANKNMKPIEYADKNGHLPDLFALTMELFS